MWNVLNLIANQNKVTLEIMFPLTSNIGNKSKPNIQFSKKRIFKKDLVLVRRFIRKLG